MALQKPKDAQVNKIVIDDPAAGPEGMVAKGHLFSTPISLQQCNLQVARFEFLWGQAREHEFLGSKSENSSAFNAHIVKPLSWHICLLSTSEKMERNAANFFQSSLYF